MDCKTARQVLILYAADELDGDQLSGFAAHVGECPECQTEADHARRLVIVLRQRCRCLRISAPDHLRLRILASLPHHRARSH